MSELAPEQQQRASALAQLPIAVVAFVLFGVEPLLGAVALVAMFALWRPPGMTWLPAKPLPVVALYAPWLVLWTTFACGYLRLMPTEPQAMLLQLAEQGCAMPNFWLWVFVIVVMAPVVEEIAFRGYLFTAMQHLMPNWATQLLVATLFGLVHGLDHALPIGALSLLFGYLRQRYRSILPSMLAHATHNGLTVALAVNFPELLDLFYNR